MLLAQRNVLYKTHRWLSLALMAWILLESVTGAAIVFGPEIDRWWNRDRYDATPGDVGIEGAIGAATDDHGPPEALRILEQLHFNLNSTSISGLEATTIVGWLGVGWLLILIAGFSVWYWPRVKRWARALRVRRGRGRLVFNSICTTPSASR